MESVNQPALQVCSQADAGCCRAEDYCLGEDASHQVIDIGGATDGDCPAKDVAEEQDEHDRLDRGEDQLLRNAWDLDQVALCQDECIGNVSYS